jgi:Domain of unknown function (DUF1929)/Bacterial Ig domain/Glyoxal oxidase N-terminus/Galactose oxidase, central domain/Kelch motif
MKHTRLQRLAIVPIAIVMAVLLIAAEGALAPLARAAAPLLGNATVEPSVDADGIGLAEAFKATASSTGSVNALFVYVDTSSTATTLAAGLYSDNGGHPGTLLAQGSLSAPVAGNWNAASIPTTSLTSGTMYWLALLGASGSGQLAFRDACCGGGTASETSSQSNLSTLPATWSSGTRYADGPVSIYAGTLTPPPPPGQVGQWSSVVDLPLVAIHAITMHTGNVLLMDGWQNPNQTQVFNPTTQALSPANNGFGLDVFCSAHVTLADGRILLTGGEGSTMLGSAAVTVFDPVTQTWSRLPNMKAPRWYPTATELGDGRVLVISGQDTNTTWVDTPEIYDPTANTWTLLSKISTSQVHEQEYPLSYLLPSGKIVTIAPNAGQSFLLDPSAQTWSAVGGATLYNGSAAQYLPGKILYTGGGSPFNSTNPSTTNARVIDFTSATPTWQAVAPMNYARYTHTLTVLPDGKVLAVGGSGNLSETDTTQAVYPAEEWDPTTNTWTILSSMQIPRIYHATALLLPDGRVLVAGSGHEENLTGPGEYNAQYYSPPYLFNGARPTITSIPASFNYGDTISIQTPDASSIAKVSLVSLGADSHTLDMNQHFVPLSFTAGSGSLTVSSPTSANVAPPGYYMVFIVNGNGVPSVASIVHIGAPVDTTPPTVSISAPADGTTVSGSSVTVSATATDNVAVGKVQFLLDGNPLGSPVLQAPYTLNWDSTTVANGTHSLSARATDTAGNVATATAVSVTVNNPVPTGATVDTSISTDGRGPVSASVSTSAAGDLLLAFVSSDGLGSPQTVTVSGGGLTWTLVKRVNAQGGDSEIWSARASSQLSGATVTATQSTSGYYESLTVVAFKGAAGVGASVTGNASSGAPTVKLTTTKAQSLVYAVGNDYDNAVARTPGTGQVLVHQWVETATGDTFWVQRISGYNGAAGAVVTVNDTAPTGDRWNLTAVEVLSS